MLFHYAQEPVLAVDEVSALVSLPIIGTILLFAKSQYDEVQVKEVALEREIKDLDTTVKKEATLEHTLKKFIQPKLMLLKKLLDDPEETKETVLKQVTLMETELEKITDRVEAIGEVQPSVEK
jgi:flagellar motor component MotA